MRDVLNENDEDDESWNLLERLSENEFVDPAFSTPADLRFVLASPYFDCPSEEMMVGLTMLPIPSEKQFEDHSVRPWQLDSAASASDISAVQPDQVAAAQKFLAHIVAAGDSDGCLTSLSQNPPILRALPNIY